MLTRVLIAIAAFSMLTLAACGDAPSESECKKLMNHLISIEMGAGGGGAVSEDLEADRDAVKKRVLGYLEEDFMKSCLKSLPKSQVTCGLKATSTADLAACDES